jgi:hypothetical protein
LVVAAEVAAKRSPGEVSESAVKVDQPPLEKTAEMKQLAAVREAVDAGAKSGSQLPSGSQSESPPDDILDKDSVEDSRVANILFPFWVGFA